MGELIINDIVIAFREYIPFAIITGIIIIIAICILQIQISKKITILSNRKKLILIYVLYVYCFIVVSITFLSREPGSRDGVDLKLFSTCSQNIYNNRYPIENIILFVPFGFLLPLIWNRFYNAVTCIVAGFIFSIAIEVSQYLTKRGFFQTDDIITNIVGTILGFGVAFTFRLIINNVKSKSQCNVS
jgi:glycopeptide antibiotics resistance protein